MAAADFVPLAGYTTLHVLGGGTKPLSQRTLGRRKASPVRCDISNQEKLMQGYIRENLPLLLALALAVLSSKPALAARLVSTGVTYNAETKVYTYNYALDNRAQVEPISQFGIVIFPGLLYGEFPALPHTSPPGWQFFTAFSGGYGPYPATTYQWWYNPEGLPAGAYLAGFSFSTTHPPRTASTANYRLLYGGGPSLPYSEETGVVVAPEMLVSIPTTAAPATLLFVLLVALIGAMKLQA